MAAGPPLAVAPGADTAAGAVAGLSISRVRARAIGYRLSIDVVDGATLRIVSWNCARGLDAKRAARLLDLGPDVAVIQECAETAELDGMFRVAWAGAIPDKGMAVFARPEVDAEPLDANAEVRRWCLPVRLAALDVDVLGVWGFAKNGKAGPPREVARTAINGVGPVLTRARAVVIGDFNDGPHFDAGNGRSFARTWELLESAGYRSLYHARTREAYGAETAATLFFKWRRAEPFLIDHAFLPAAWLDAVRGFDIGSPERWLDVSDHMPLVLDLAAPRPNEPVGPAAGPST